MQKNKKKVILVMGARPNFMKVAPIWRELIKERNSFQPVLVHTEQHYDFKMSEIFFQELSLPKPHYLLGVLSSSHATQIAKVMIAFEEVLLSEEPDIVIVVGDVNSTVASAMTAVKLQIPVVHVEAGLRSYDRSMPEEINRLITDTISDLLLTPSKDASENLKREGVEENRVHLVGNIMIDSLRLLESQADTSSILENLRVGSGEYIFLTLHRASNVDCKGTLRNLIWAFTQIQYDIPLVWSVHPRTQKMIEQFELTTMLEKMSNTKFLEPVGYLDSLKLQKNAKLVLTDSGGLQEETTAFCVPCLTVRENTDRPITITEGTNTLVGNDLERIVSEVISVLNGTYKVGKIPYLWDGRTASRIVKSIDKTF